MRGSVRRRSRGSWELTVDVGRDAEGKRVRQFRTVRGTKAEAERVLNQLLRAAEMSQGVMSSRVLLGEFMDRWLEERVYPRLRSQTCMLYAREVRLRLRPELGDIPLQCLAARDVSAMEERLSRGGAGRSVLQTCRQVLSTVLNYAVHLELVSRNPVNGMGGVGYHRREPVILDVESVMRVLRHLRECEPGLHAPCHLVAHTGMRSGEVLALRWADVSLEGGHLAVVNNLMKVSGGGLGAGPPKTRAGRQRIDLDAGTVEVLREHGVRQLARRTEVGDAWRDLGLVFPNDVGGYMSRDALLGRLQRRASGLGVMGLTVRAFRHFHASVTLQEGHNPVVVSKRLGHSRVSVTLDIYAHALPAWQRDVAEGVAGAWRE